MSFEDAPLIAPIVKSTGAQKDLKGKAPLQLVPILDCLEPMSWVTYYSAQENGGKYPMHDWKKMTPDQCIHLLRGAISHIAKHMAGEVFNPEDNGNLPHLYHAQWNVNTAISILRKKSNIFQKPSDGDVA